MDTHFLEALFNPLQTVRVLASTRGGRAGGDTGGQRHVSLLLPRKWRKCSGPLGGARQGFKGSIKGGY